MKWAIAIIIILVLTTAETILSVKTYKKHVGAGTYEANKKRIILIRICMYLLIYLIGFGIYAFSS